MERLDFHSNSSISYLSDERPCQADESLRSDSCKRRGGQIEPERARSARYCSACAPIVRREQSKLGKRKLRRNPRWRAIQREYRKQRRAKHRDYMHGWRALRRQTMAAAHIEEQHCAA
jgi:hypothetical protein